MSQVPPDLAGNNALVVKRGADALGWSGDFIYRNARGCVGSGVCAFGCPTSAKQHTGITYVPRAWEAGAVPTAAAARERIVVEGGRARGVEAATAGGGVLRVARRSRRRRLRGRPHPAAAGAQRARGRSGQLGRNLAIHPATAVRALFDEDIDMAKGVPQSFYIDEFAGERIMFEGAAGPPDYLAMSFPFSRERHRDLMLRYRQLAAVRADGVRPLARPRARARRPGGDPLRPRPGGRGGLQARHRADDRALLGGRGQGGVPAGRGHRRAARRATPARSGSGDCARATWTCSPSTRSAPRAPTPARRTGW